MKPNRIFLQKVSDGCVYSIQSYSVTQGSFLYFVGGEKTAQKHADAGFINMPGHTQMWVPAKATLTDAGRAALSE